MENKWTYYEDMMDIRKTLECTFDHGRDTWTSLFVLLHLLQLLQEPRDASSCPIIQGRTCIFCSWNSEQNAPGQAHEGSFTMALWAFYDWTMFLNLSNSIAGRLRSLKPTCRFALTHTNSSTIPKFLKGLNIYIYIYTVYTINIKRKLTFPPATCTDLFCR